MKYLTDPNPPSLPCPPRGLELPPLGDIGAILSSFSKEDDTTSSAETIKQCMLSSNRYSGLVILVGLEAIESNCVLTDCGVSGRYFFRACSTSSSASLMLWIASLESLSGSVTTSSLIRSFLRLMMSPSDTKMCSNLCSSRSNRRWSQSFTNILMGTRFACKVMNHELAYNSGTISYWSRNLHRRGSWYISRSRNTRKTD
mmetsp:Transcript_6357/g.15356  ORF Transcript_6357/g.15356 Transcript_6357/m.15356 type:complete len:200 (+) Transcript_6357:1193-1792(+)